MKTLPGYACNKRLYRSSCFFFPVFIVISVLMPFSARALGLILTDKTRPGADITISGIVWHDRNGNLSREDEEPGTNAGGILVVNLVDDYNNVVFSAIVSADGHYQISAPANVSNYRLVLCTGSDTTDACLPGNGAAWINTGEHTDGTNTADQMYSPVGEIALNTHGQDVSGQDFGIELRPVAWVLPLQLEASGWQIPALGGADTEDSQDDPGIYAIRIQELPASGVLYYNRHRLMAGSTVYNYQPALLQFEADAYSDLDFTFSAVDLAGQESLPVTATLKPVREHVAGNIRSANLDIFPNPVRDHLHLSGGRDCRMIRLIDSGGRVLYHAEQVEQSINMEGMDHGTYFLQVQQSDFSVSSIKLVKL